MLSEEEKKAIKNIKKEFEKNHILPDIANEDLGTLLNLIEKQSKEIEELSDKLTEKICKGVEEEILEEYRQTIISKDKEIEHQKEKRENQKKELAILNAKQIEFNKLVNTVNSYKGQFKRQQKEIEELKEKNNKLMEELDLTTVYISGVYDGKKKVEDKIKAKIEEYEKMKEATKMDTTYYGEKRRSVIEGVIAEFQSLLEKE